MILTGVETYNDTDVTQTFPAAVEVRDCIPMALLSFGLRTGRHPIFLPAQHPDVKCGLSSVAATASPWEHCSLETVPVHKLTNLLFYFILALKLSKNNSKYRKPVSNSPYTVEH